MCQQYVLHVTDLCDDIYVSQLNLSAICKMLYVKNVCDGNVGCIYVLAECNNDVCYM